MRVAVISDIHANARALEAVLAEIEAEAPDELWCLGDVVGYGPDPDRCCELVARHASLCLAGNHDLAVTGELSVADFNGDAAVAVRWTQQAISPQSLAFLRGLSPLAHRDGVELFHGSPLDPVWDYVLSEQTARRSFELTHEPLLLVGHSHVALALAFDGTTISGGIATPGESLSLGARRHLLNPGSVGQPRAKDPRSGWLMLDLDVGLATFRRTSYPVAATQQAIRERGLPETLAVRLALGV